MQSQGRAAGAWGDFQDFHSGVSGLSPSENIQDFSTNNAQERNEEAFAGTGQQKKPRKTTSWEALLIGTDVFFNLLFERTLIKVPAKAPWNSLASGSSEALFQNFQILC